MQGHTIKLTSFIALSLLAHGLLFLTQTNPQPKMMYSSLGTPKLSVSLSIADSQKKEHTKPAKQNTSPQTSQLTPQDSSQESVKQITLAQKASKVVTTIQSIAPITKQESTQNTASKTTQRNFLLGEIQHRLSRYLNYPTRARRRGWEGEVTVGFNVDKQGFLRNVHLSQTSGYPLLDNAALTAIGKVKNIPLSPWIKQSQDNIFHPAALQLPVTYRLTNS